jgi:hypothetical protein
MSGDTVMSILTRLIDPTTGSLSRAAAEAILSISFPESDNKRIAELAELSTAGALTPETQREYESYVAAIDLLALMQSKARLSLQQQTSAA